MEQQLEREDINLHDTSYSLTRQSLPCTVLQDLSTQFEARDKKKT